MTALPSTPWTPPPAPARRAWKGGWLLAVAGIHTAFALAVFPAELRALLQRGLFDSVGADALAGAVVWFVLFGAVLALLGAAVLLLERAPAPAAALRPLGWGLLALAVVGIVLMPASGFWLVLPPALALCRRPQGARP